MRQCAGWYPKARARGDRRYPQQSPHLATGDSIIGGPQTSDGPPRAGELGGSPRLPHIYITGGSRRGLGRRAHSARQAKVRDLGGGDTRWLGLANSKFGSPDASEFSSSLALKQAFSAWDRRVDARGEADVGPVSLRGLLHGGNALITGGLRSAFAVRGPEFSAPNVARGRAGFVGQWVGGAFWRPALAGWPAGPNTSSAHR